MMVMPAPTLEVDLEDIAVNWEDFYQIFIGMDVISGFQGVMGPAEIYFLGATVKGHIC